ncbi:MAG: hypothetical protein JNJ86_10150 [Chitinophagaceae bacterium]|nr:hypothetical protein [Chitinophagaceae bacterium]
MKQAIIKIASPGFTRQLLLFAGVILCLLSAAPAVAQADSTAQQPAAEAPAAAEEELISPSVELISIQKADKSVDLKIAVKAKIEKKMRKMYGLKVNVFQVTDSAEQELGSVITDRNGLAVFTIKPEQVTTNAEGMLHFKAVLGPVKKMESTEGEVTVKRALLTITPVKEDSLYSVQVKLVDLATGEETPVPQAVLGIFVKRSFNPLKIGEITTDESGEGSAEIANTLPGDAKGNITLLARLDENETYGNLEAAVVQQWGVPVSDKIEDQPRALWSSHPPLWMLITFIILMLAVWGHYIVIVYELFRLRKEQPHATNS